MVIEKKRKKEWRKKERMAKHVYTMLEQLHVH